MFNRTRPKFLNRLFPGWFQVMPVVPSLASDNLGSFRLFLVFKDVLMKKYRLTEAYPGNCTGIRGVGKCRNCQAKIMGPKRNNLYKISTDSPLKL